MEIASIVVPDAIWQTEGSLVRLKLPPLGGWLDVERIAAGIAGLSMAGRPLEPLPGEELGAASGGGGSPETGQWGILGLELPGAAGPWPRPCECYPRQHDLLAWFSAREDWPVEVQAIWRGVPAGEGRAFAAAVDLIVGVRTQRPEAAPSFSVLSTLPACQAFAVGAVESDMGLGPWGWARQGGPTGAYLFRLGGGWSYVEMVHPATPLAGQSCLGEAGISRLRHRLFGEPAEKLERGVLLRAWIRGALVPQEDDMRRAACVYEQFAASEPPLSG